MFKKEAREAKETKEAYNSMKKLKWENHSMIISSKWTGDEIRRSVAYVPSVFERVE